MASGLYLLYLAVTMWRHARDVLTVQSAPAERRQLGRSFLTAFATQMSNPKAAVVYGSVFAALLPQHPPSWWYFAIPPVVFFIEAGWYALVALALSSTVSQRLYARAKRWVDRVAAVVIGALGIRLVLGAIEN